MSIKVSQAFERTSANPIDATFALTKADMLTVNDNLMPNYYFTICQDDGKIYLYDKSATPSATTGKFAEFVSGGDSDGSYLTTATLSTTINDTTVVAATDLTTLDFANIVVGETLIYDGDGTVGVITAVNGTTDVTVTTMTIVGSTGGGGELETDIVVNNPIGRYANGDTIAAGTDFETIFRGMLTNVYYPTLTNPSVSLTYNLPTYAKVGSTITSRAATLNFNQGSINPQYTATSPYRSGAATNYALATTGADTEYSDSSTSSGSFTVAALTRATKGDITITGTVSYAAGVQPKDSDGNDYDSPLPAGSVTTSKKVSFIQPFYWGVADSKPIADFTGLTESVTAKGNKTVSYTTNNQFMVFAYDASYGNITSILDPNGFEVIGGWTKTNLTVDGFNYFVWTADLATTDTGANFTFKF